jgi:DNA-directed RNA polymerase subunit M/transcription elongation factor TFIIS
MAFWYSRRCPRCGGDLYLDEDETGRFYVCFQCAREYAIEYIERLAAEKAREAAAERAEKEVAVAGARR